MNPLHYCDIICDKNSFCDKIEQVQFNATLAVTGAVIGLSMSHLYKELVLESLRV